MSSSSSHPHFSPRDADSVRALVAVLAITTARLLSVGHRLDIATVVQLCEVVHHGGHFGVHFRVSLDSSSACHVVLRLDDRHVPGVVVTCSATMFVGRPVCCHVSVLLHCA